MRAMLKVSQVCVVRQSRRVAVVSAAMETIPPQHSAACGQAACEPGTLAAPQLTVVAGTPYLVAVDPLFWPLLLRASFLGCAGSPPSSEPRWDRAAKTPPAATTTATRTTAASSK